MCRCTCVCMRDKFFLLTYMPLMAGKISGVGRRSVVAVATCCLSNEPVKDINVTFVSVSLLPLQKRQTTITSTTSTR